MAFDEQSWHELVSGARRGPDAALARAGLWALSGPYALAMRVRRDAYRRGLLRSQSARVPVISVGNVTVGGTGKTPMVAWVVGRLKEAGHTPAVLIRGYRAVEGRSDEADWLAQTTGAPVIVKADRVAGAAEAAAQGADVCVLDDGFQHRRLRRQLDLVLLDAAEPLGFGHCLPRGLLREPPAALADAGAVVLTRCDQAEPGPLEAARQIAARLAPQAPLYEAYHRPVGVVGPDGQTRPARALAGMRVLAFAGIARPRSFWHTLVDLGADVAATVPLNDHFAYTDALLADLRARARAAGAVALVTTTKDRVKLPPDTPDLYALQIAMALPADQADALTARLLAAARPTA